MKCLPSIHSIADKRYWNLDFIRLIFIQGLVYVAGYLLALLAHGYFYVMLENQQTIALCLFGCSFVVAMIGLIRQFSFSAVLLLFLVTFFLFGIWHATTVLHTQRQQRLAPELHQSPVWLYGYANDFIRIDNQGERFFFTVRCSASLQAINKKLLTNPCVDLNKPVRRVYARRNAQYLNVSSLPIKPGVNGWMLVTLREPRGFANPAGFDWGKWLFVERVYAVASIQCNVAEPCWYPVDQPHIVLRLRYRISQWLTQVLPPGAAREILPALWINDRSHMSNETRQILTVFGLMHLVSISGFHITLIAVIGYWFGKRAWYFFGWRTHFGGRQIMYATAGATLFALIYSALAGFNVPTMRALIMVIVVGWSRCYKKSNILWPSYWLSFFICVMAFPLSPLTSGFWLSFIAVAILLKIFTHRWPPYRGWQAFFRAQIFITLGLMPLSLAIQNWHWSSVWINAIAIPITEIFIMPLSLIWAFGSAVTYFLPNNIHNFWVNVGAFILYESFAWIFDALATYQKDTQLKQQAAGLRWWSFGAVAILLTAMFFVSWQKIFREKLRYAGVGFFLFLMTQLKPDPPAIGQAIVSVLDIGQGLAIVVQTQNHTLIYDTGDQWSADHDAGNSIILPYLHWLGINQLDAMVLSHADKDHVGGADSILDRIPVKKLIGVARENRNAHACYRGQHWQWDSVQFEILSPKKHSASTVDNNLSCVLKITDRHRSFLLTGDIERATEENLLKEMRETLKADILLAPHHGSRTSSTSGFIDAVSPQWVIFSAGYRHRFGHPHDEVTARYAVRAVKILNTADHGTVIWNNEILFLMPTTWRQRFHWAWY
ncbi:MAG: DNA internalization-related competence protein ComEC/Rec2 [Pseudomonadota bacterium]